MNTISQYGIGVLEAIEFATTRDLAVFVLGGAKIRSRRRSAGLVSNEIGSGSSVDKADSFGSAPDVGDGRAAGSPDTAPIAALAGASVGGVAGAEVEADNFGCALSALSGNDACSGSSAFQPIRRSNLRTAFSATPSCCAIARLDRPCALS